MHSTQKIIYSDTLKSFIERVKNDYDYIILDTPSVAVKSHAFYDKSGFRRIIKAELPIEYHYPDRDSLLYMIDLEVK